MGIRSLLVPFAYLVAAVLGKLRVSIYALVTFSFLGIFATIIAFYMIFEAAFNAEIYAAAAAVGIFLCGFSDEVIRELSRKKKQPSFPLAIAKHSDLLLVFGILYIYMSQPYSVILPLTLNEAEYGAVAILIAGGVLITDFVARRIEKRYGGLETRAERMYLLTGFVLLGFYFQRFELSIFLGIIAITAYLYAWVIWKKLDFYGLGESIYAGFDRIYRRIARAGVPDIKVPGAPSRGEEGAEDFKEYGQEEYDSTGYNFTTVVNDRRSEPVSNVKVTLSNVETGETYTGYTDPSGRASFMGVSEGQYDITLECEGFKSAEFERYISMDSGEVFVLKRPYTDLSIVITDKTKAMPIPSAQVNIRQPGEDRPAMTKAADNLGVAYFDELDVRTWEIHVSAAGYGDWSREINLEEENVVSVTLEKGKPKEEEPPEAEKPEEKIEPKEEEPKKEKEEPEPEEIEEPAEEEPETGGDEREEVGLQETLSDSALFEYFTVEDVRPLVSRMVEEYKSHDIDIYLVSTPERAEEYSGLGVKIVDVPEEPGKFKEVLEEMPAGSVLIFEPLSNLIITGGFAAAFKFLKKTLDYTESEGLTLACYVNPRAHEEKEMKKLRKLLNSVTIEGDKLFR
jgi:hypothetical protein